MIKFFRKIRARLLTENQLTRYVLYAIGEIILVVIGILLALQINNWNETNKNAKEERKLLSLLNEDFSENKIRLQETIILENTVVDYSKKLIDVMQSKNTSVPIDTLVNYIVKGAKSWWRTEFVTGTYDAMLGSGKINILANDNLKRLLAQFSAEVKSGFEDHYESINYLIELNEISAHLTSELILDDQLERLGMTKNPEKIRASVYAFIENETYKGLVLSKTWMEINRLDYLYKIQDYIHEILSIIGSEINSLDEEISPVGGETD